MVPGTKDSNQAIATPSVEDDATKRNTDCVYFLASPLTCKKGSECEYRHSEHARVNPRDCWYWLNGSCLNPKCAFRHPPLDGLLGSQPTATAGTALLLPQAVTPSPLAAPQSKQTVPCIFFQKGVCLKGDKCAFSHGPNSVPTKPPHVTPAAEVTGTKNVFGVSQRSAQDSKRYQPNISNSNKFADDKLNSKMSSSPPKANAANNRVVLPSTEFNASFKSSTIGSNGMHQAEIFDDHVMRNGKDADDLYRESSPGFDVLVDDEVAEDQYYDADEYGTRGAHEGRSVNDYGALPDADHEMLHDPQGYDGYDRLSGQYARDQNWRASEKILRGTVSIEGRNNRKGGCSDRIGQSDLRHRLKGSGLRSVISDNYEQRRSDDSRRDSRLVPPLESSMSSRLQGRIKDPRRSPVRSSISDRDIERGRNRSRTSPIRSQIRDRIGSRGQDDFGNRRSLRGYGMQREGSADGLVEFSGPKTLSELKTCKSSVKDRLISGQESFSLGKRKSTGEREQLDSSLSFEGPKPLSEILKRKKSAEMNVPGSGSTENKETNKTESAENTGIIKEELKSVSDVSEMKIEPDNIPPSETLNSNQIDQDMGITGGEGIEDPNLEGYDQGEDGEEYYYEEDGGEYDLEEGENAEGEYVDEENGEDFEKKIGGMFS